MDHIDSKPRRRAVLAMAFAFITGMGCGPGDERPPLHQPPPPTKVTQPPVPQGPAPAAQMRTIEVTEEKVAEGKALFATCAGCHGQEATGMVGQGPRLNSETFLAAASDEFLKATITHGRAGTTMIAWGTTFQPPQIEALVAYLRSLQPSEAATLNEAPLKSDVTHGKQLFQSICYTCHGRTGAGYQETANGTGIGRKAFLDSVSNGYLRYVIENGKSQTQMRPFVGTKLSVAKLTPKEIDDVIGYLRTQAW